MPWLGLFILRLLMGERFRKATPKELRFYSGVFALMPIWMVLFIPLGHPVLDHADMIGIWLYIMVFITGCAFWIAAWVKFIPTNVSWWIGGVVWVTAFALAFSGILEKV